MASKERGLICTGESVRAFLADRKSQTRRVAKLPKEWHTGVGAFKNNPHGDEVFVIHGDCGTKTMYCPYGRVGDKLYVKETFQIEQYTFRRNCVGGKYLTDNKEFWTEVTQREYNLIMKRKFPLRVTSGRFMYKSLARIWREIAGVRLERVQDITPENCEKEGLKLTTNPNLLQGKYRRILEDFKNLWDSINAKRGYPWSDEELPEGMKTGHGRILYGNPWVWVLELRKVNDAEKTKG
ncbi:hypothetical protein LCGC14_0878100 [marine sediment metagenome]|uniref:Uncharacterized protein n=1 Tax=marine sediment metagenome TaxID=412755 RepID=A0A0F9S9Q0_9ZZZZ